MDADQLAETTMARGHRTLRRMTVDDEPDRRDHPSSDADGNDVGPRKTFIVDGAYALDSASIDVWNAHDGARHAAACRAATYVQ